MPITRRQFELGVDAEIEGWMDKIHNFLSEHKDEAFNSEELWKTIYGKPAWQPAVREAFDEALIKLVDQEMAARRIIRETSYYAYKEKLELEDIPF